VTVVLAAEALSKRFLKNERYLMALEDFSLAVEDGSFVVILGRSGCGKSTFLNMAAGLTKPTSGRVLFNGKPKLGPSHEVGYLTQTDSLMPWRTVRRNVEMPLELRGVTRQERVRAAGELIDRVGLSGFERHYPRELSGGMRRRASLARMLISNPQMLLLDEPFGALDAQLRQDLQKQLLDLWQASGRTVVFVTHDIEEAILLADRVVVLAARGRIVVDKPITLERPRDLEQPALAARFAELRHELTVALREAAAA
jgi:NitT/TauT family transport system ATP-binding protein